MNIKTFIDRPIFAGVISVMILLLGLIGLLQLPVEQFPEIAPPTVSVSAAYAGANAEIPSLFRSKSSFCMKAQYRFPQNVLI